MKFSQPLVLLLGGVLSASGVGCSAINAIVTDSRPAHRENRSDSDRIAAIGRVFENQGRYDKAEAMYRRALKDRPQDSELRSQLQQLAERRKEQSFGPSRTATAIAVADMVSPPKATVRPVRVAPQTRNEPEADDAALLLPAGFAARVVPQATNEPEVHLSLPLGTNAAAVTDFETLPPLPAAGMATLAETSPIVSNASHTTGPIEQIELASGKSDGWRKSGGHVVTMDAVMTALESPDQYLDLLLEGLVRGDSTETKALAATLLGDCDPSNQKAREALAEQLNSQSTPDVVLAVCDSQIERREENGQTVSRLIGLCSANDHETQIQATSQLRNFAGSEFEPQCKTVLGDLLENAGPSVRATAALTLGDFTSLNAATTARLHELATQDASSNVREAAESTLSRQQLDTLQVIPNLNIAPQ